MGKDMDLNFEIFMIVLLVLSIVVVGNFLRDGESNYLEGALLVVCFWHCSVSSLNLSADPCIDRLPHRGNSSLVLSEPRCCYKQRC